MISVAPRWGPPIARAALLFASGFLMIVIPVDMLQRCGALVRVRVHQQTSCTVATRATPTPTSSTLTLVPTPHSHDDDANAANAANAAQRRPTPPTPPVAARVTTPVDSDLDAVVHGVSLGHAPR